MKHRVLLLLALTTRVASASPRSLSIETEAIQPFVPTVGIIHLRVSRPLWRTPAGAHGDLVIGAYLRPHIAHDVVEHIDEYMATAGLRYFAWRGLHVEALLDAGVAWGTNKLDGMAYTTPTLFGELNAGYRFGERFFVTPQVGLLSSLGLGNDIGPRGGKPDYFLQAALLVGASL